MSDAKNDEVVEYKKPFKLCFAKRSLPGRSSVQIGKPLKIRKVKRSNPDTFEVLASIITPKFYRIDKLENCTVSELEKHMEYLNVKGPREKYSNPATENQKYGWYQIQFTDLDRSDRRLHFAKQTNPIITEHLMNYANIR